MPEIASRHHLELIGDAVDDALATAPASSSPTSSWSPSPRARGWSRRCSSGSRPRRRSPPSHELPLAAGRSPARPRRRQLSGARAVRAAVPQPGRERRPHVAGARRAIAGPATRCSARRSTTPPARRSTRARGCSGSAIRAARRSSGSRATAIRRRSRSRPPRACAGLDFSFAGLKTALLYRVRDLGEAEAERRRADLAASYQRAIVEALARARGAGADRRPACDRLAIGGGVAANGPLRERLAQLGVDARRPAARAVHRQRGDDRQRGALRRAAAVSRTTWSSTCTRPASGRRSGHECAGGPVTAATAAACATRPARC